MAVKLNKVSHLSALALALASLTLPAIAEAQERGNWRGGREDRSESRGNGNGAGRSDGGSRGDGGSRSEGGRNGGGGWQQRSQAPAPQSAPQRGWSQRSAQPAPQAATPPAPSRATWGRDGGNTRNWEGRGNREARSGDDRRSWEGRSGRDGRSWQSGAAAPTRVRPAVPADSSRWSGRGSRDDDGRRDRDGRRDGSWSSGSGTQGWNGSGRSYRDSDRYRDGRNYRDGDRDHRRWDRQWRSNNRYNWYSWRQNYPHYYNLGSYYSPYRNYRYRRLSIGFFLDSLFYSNRYWISNPGYYRLPDAYGPYRWVRYYNDALLVDIYSGEVVDVIHNFFW